MDDNSTIITVNDDEKEEKRMTNKNRKINLWDRKSIYPTDLLFNPNSKN